MEETTDNMGPRRVAQLPPLDARMVPKQESEVMMDGINSIADKIKDMRQLEIQGEDKKHEREIKLQEGKIRLAKTIILPLIGLGVVLCVSAMISGKYDLAEKIFNILFPTALALITGGILLGKKE